MDELHATRGSRVVGWGVLLVVGTGHRKRMAFFLSTGSPQPPPYLHSTRWTGPLLGSQQGPPVSAQRHGAPSRRPSRPPAASPAMFPWRLAQSLSGAEIDLPRSMFCPIPGCPLTPMEISTHHPLKSPRKWEPWRPMPPLIATAQQQRVGPPSLGFTAYTLHPPNLNFTPHSRITFACEERRPPLQLCPSCCSPRPARGPRCLPVTHPRHTLSGLCLKPRARLPTPSRGSCSSLLHLAAPLKQNNHIGTTLPPPSFRESLGLLAVVELTSQRHTKRHTKESSRI